MGENIATTPGKVVYQNELMQLIQYAPSTGRVRTAAADHPALDQASFYILDLKAKNLFAGHGRWIRDTIFAISLGQPDETLRNKRL